VTATCRVETSFISPVEADGMSSTFIIGGVLALILVFIFFIYLLLRRTAQGFKEGMDEGGG
jgi:flagellar biogenesis protein FliO